MKLFPRCASLSMVLLVAGSTLAAPPIADEQTIIRETNGSRDALTAMELKPFNASSLSTLTDWSGTAIDAAAMKEKVVVVAFWSSWIPSNQTMVARLGALSAKYADKGLVVIAAHNDSRFENAATMLSEKGIKLLTAKDAGNKLRAALHSDADPDVYVIDRAGNMRYADIDSASVETAVKTLVAETPDQAAARPAGFLKELKDVRDAAARTTIVGTGIDPGQKLKVTFAPPDPALYDKALWPAKNDEKLVTNITNIQGQKLPFEFGSEIWLTEKPQFLGKVVIIDFWATWCGPCKKAMPLLDEMQKTMRDDLVIVGVSGSKFGGNSGDNEKYDQGEDKPTVERFFREHNSEYYHCYDTGSKFCKPLNITAIPQMIIISSDGVVRWQGNPHQPFFRKTVEQIINVDPGVAARRAAEAKAIKNKGG